MSHYRDQDGCWNCRELERAAWDLRCRQGRGKPGTHLGKEYNVVELFGICPHWEGKDDDTGS